MQRLCVFVQRRTKSAQRGIMMGWSSLSMLARMSFGKRERRGVQRQMLTAKQGTAPVDTVLHFVSLVFHLSCTSTCRLHMPHLLHSVFCAVLIYSRRCICSRAVCPLAMRGICSLTHSGKAEECTAGPSAISCRGRCLRRRAPWLMPKLIARRLSVTAKFMKRLLT